MVRTESSAPDRASVRPRGATRAESARWCPTLRKADRGTTTGSSTTGSSTTGNARRAVARYDVVVIGAGLDAVTGALDRIDIRGRDGASLRDAWAGGPRTLLGLQVAGFPNFFTITGPGSPSVHTNMVVAIEQHVDWIGDCLMHVRDTGCRTIEATAEAQDNWAEHVASLVTGTIRASDACSSWYTGANVPGKPRVYLAYTAGQPLYRQTCDEVAAAGYEGFVCS